MIEAIKQARQIIWRYRHETPLGKQPHMIAHEADEVIERIDQALETKDEPAALVAEVHISRYTIEWTNGPLPEGTKLYTTPQRKPLTREDIDKLHEEDCFSGNIYEITAEIEAAHGIKE